MYTSIVSSSPGSCVDDLSSVECDTDLLIVVVVDGDAPSASQSCTFNYNLLANGLILLPKIVNNSYLIHGVIGIWGQLFSKAVSRLCQIIFCQHPKKILLICNLTTN